MFKKILKFNKVTSTQDICRRLIPRQEELAVFAYTQSRGRGRQSRPWFSPKGGLYMSLLLFPENQSHTLPLAAALAVIRILEGLGFKHPVLHWPNDVLLENHKVCGILCEQVRNAFICGIGLNVNTQKFDRNAEHATSLGRISGREYNIEMIMNDLIRTFYPLYRETQKEGLDIKIVKPYLSGIGEMVEVRGREGTIRGTVFDIDPDWALLLTDSTGMIRKFYYGDVRRMQW
jgi:BirA family biotin operon repressor/biotin-[acetyl-CoA-carboxylase] ligase